MTDPPSLEELERLYSTLTPAERNELLQEILTAAPHRQGATLAVLEAWLLDAAARQLLTEFCEQE